MTKREVIQRAWGEHWDEVKDLVDENGVVFNVDRKNWYPLSIENIQYNNGWLPITAIPPENVDILVLEKKGQVRIYRSTQDWHWKNGNLKAWRFLPELPLFDF